ncbi:Protein CBR-PTP-1 [Caenorhabditis briggsae]|uniref:Tyrosine-protein phosphatase n=2 Tax=Caenorhabditis briggsae TaxID=6238 RepID=A8X9K5_CAEBR|nr:Protein CBR-PTP-1 [Caenorhabditis briggsae]CAP29320.1 Protein CBR-PTP-1 [Caenorhabditis briggsae]
MRLGSNSYDVQRTEAIGQAPVKSPPPNQIRCTVTFLDSTSFHFEIEKNSLGIVLLEKVFNYLEIIERDYFGLVFIAVDSSSTQQKKWLDPSKNLRKQMVCPPYHLFFRVKFFVRDPNRLRDEFTRFQFYQQVRQNLEEGKLPCNEGSLALLASYVVQVEVGDFEEKTHGMSRACLCYKIQFATLPDDFSDRVAELHQLHIGQTPDIAEQNFLDHARRLEMYGMDVYDGRDANNLLIEIGVGAVGIKVFHDGIKMDEYAWARIRKLSFKKKQFQVLVANEEGISETNIVFNIMSAKTCKLLWKCCIEQHTFFRLKAPPKTPQRKVFNFGSKFRYSGRTEYQTLEENEHRKSAGHRNFHRSLSKSSFLRSTFSGNTQSIDSSRYTNTTTTDSPELPSSGQLLARRLLSSARHDTDSSDALGYASDGAVVCAPLITPLSPRRTRDYATDSESSAPSLRQQRLSKEAIYYGTQESCDEKSWTPSMACTSTSPGIHATASIRPSTTGTPNGASRKATSGYSAYGYANSTQTQQPTSTTNTNYSPYMNGTISRSSGIAVAKSARGGLPPTNQSYNTSSPRNSVASYSSFASAGIGGSPPRSRKSPQSNKSSSPVGEDQVVTIKMRPDRHGRFGFNVKGGADQNYPVIVSRVAPNSSADKCQPRLNEGDQVLFIDGRDVSTMSHDHVVQFIRSARAGANGGELHLTIRPNVYRLGEEIDEPDSQMVPEPARVADSVPRSDKLSQSLQLLSDALTTGKVVDQFEMLYRKKPGLTMNICRLNANASKNRYRDVCPYDDTRVILQTSGSGDYINANFVNMEIPSSGIINRYIACQGPLLHTSGDFWLMVWEQLCTTIVMLTTITERGRVKCHQYWPRLNETQEYGRLMIRCIRDKQTPNCCYREFSVRDRSTNEERRVTQMQYIAWPDHGVPDDTKHFIQFVDEVRKARQGSVDPIVVHCSAGIGRTGVLILMETAACLVESNEPVYPLDIVRTMRDQRAMLIQTPGQYTFVCDSILRAYNEGTIKPLAEYQKR